MVTRRFLSRERIAQIASEVIGDLLEGQTEQSYLEVSSTQRYRLGSPLVLEDNRLFRYSKAVADLTAGALGRLVINQNYAPGVTGHEDEDGFEGVLNSDAAIGATYVDLADTAVRAVDYYAGAHLVIFGTTVFHQHHIVRSALGNGTYVRCWLDEPIADEAVTVAMGVTAYLSPYSALAPAGSVQAGFETFMGLPLCVVEEDEYFWLQTGGPAWVTPTGVTWPGSAAQQRDVSANPADGTIQPASVNDPTVGYQRIGYLLQATGGTGADYGDALIMLQLEP